MEHKRNRWRHFLGSKSDDGWWECDWEDEKSRCCCCRRRDVDVVGNDRFQQRDGDVVWKHKQKECWFFLSLDGDDSDALFNVLWLDKDDEGMDNVGGWLVMEVEDSSKEDDDDVATTICCRTREERCTEPLLRLSFENDDDAIVLL